MCHLFCLLLSIFSAVENVVKPMFLQKIQPSDLKIRRLEYLCCIIMPL